MDPSDPLDTRILSVGTALPGPAVDNAALARRFGMDPLWEQWVDAFIGTRTRHLAVDIDTGRIRCSLADLAEQAGRSALESAGVAPADIDLVVMGTSTPDQLMPATVNVVADRLGIDQVPSFQLQSGCSGAVQALDVARQMLLTGRHRTALVLGGDVVARFYDLRARLASLPPSQLVNYVLFGDGAGAAVLTTAPAPDAVRLRAVHTRLVGLGREPGAVLEWFGPVDRHSERAPAAEDYKAIEQHVPVLAAEVVDTLLDELGWEREQVDHLLPPQLSGRMTQRIVRHLNLPGAAEVSCVDETGNNGNGLSFFQLERALAKLGPGGRAIGIAIESSKWIKSGFALERD
ncbi:3-oxoacyl-ACP synthase III family protein [Streptomyces abyssomicinicus]|uniref:3-oxoacyl-ACP synthase III family protein n=1 Tax=Streptomyces abyssomicinicus TaxID=574929 RepID=UPI00124FDEAA|nr:3-oxoacyl-ACP synthase III family protein [Streptomyces abyssomicinicus]